MKFIDQFLDSPTLRRFAVFLGILGGGLRYAAIYFPNPIYKTIATITLLIIGVYLGIIVFRVLWLKEQRHYIYQAKRYGIGYRKFEVQCIIDNDGSAKVIREVEIEAFSDISELDTIINIPEDAPNGKTREIKIGDIETHDNRNLSLEIIDSKPGRMTAKILITPPLTYGDQLHYRIHDYYLPAGLFSIDLSQEKIKKRKNPIDYFGWHINRPTRSFSLQVHFPPYKHPSANWGEVRYASSAGNTSDEYQRNEQKSLKKPHFSQNGSRQILNLEVEYPLSGLIYVLGWKPLSSDG